MASQKPATLSLTGRCYTERTELMAASVTKLPRDAACSVGDMKLYFRHDAAGVMAMREGHTNYGFSGWIAGSVWAGDSWTPVDFKTLFSTPIGYFEKLGSLDEAARRVQHTLQSIRGQQLRLVGKKYVV